MVSIIPSVEHRGKAPENIRCSLIERGAYQRNLDGSSRGVTKPVAATSRASQGGVNRADGQRPDPHEYAAARLIGRAPAPSNKRHEGPVPRALLPICHTPWHYVVPLIKRFRPSCRSCRRLDVRICRDGHRTEACLWSTYGNAIAESS